MRANSLRTSAPDRSRVLRLGSTGGGEMLSEAGGGGTGPMTSPGIDTAVVQDSKWDAGECNTVTVTNTTDAPIVWQVALTLPGTLQNFWNAKSMLAGDITVFTGEAYNAELAGKASTSFGYCLNY